MYVLVHIHIYSILYGLLLNYAICQYAYLMNFVEIREIMLEPDVFGGSDGGPVLEGGLHLDA